MKKNMIGAKMLVAGGLLLSIGFLSSCNKGSEMKSSLQASGQDLSARSIDDKKPAAIGVFPFDSSWTENNGAVGLPHNGVKFSSTNQAEVGSSSLLSPDSGFVSYSHPGNNLNDLTTGLAADFWVFARPKTGGAQCLYCICQTGAFWPTQHVLLDGYAGSQQGDTALIKVMFKANRAIPYNEEWTTVGGIPNFYNRWSHVQFSYTSTTSLITIKVNGHVVAADTLYTDDPRTNGGVRLGAIVANPNPKGMVVAAFQNTWDPVTFGAPQSWMLPFGGRIDNIKIYNKPIF